MDGDTIIGDIITGDTTVGVKILGITIITVAGEIPIMVIIIITTMAGDILIMDTTITGHRTIKNTTKEITHLAMRQTIEDLAIQEHR